jgi:hypothetical protein
MAAIGLRISCATPAATRPSGEALALRHALQQIDRAAPGFGGFCSGAIDGSYDAIKIALPGQVQNR